MSEDATLNEFVEAELDSSEPEAEDLARKTVCGIPPQDWTVARLGEMVRVVSGNSLPTEYQNGKEGEHPVYKVSDMNAIGNQKYVTNTSNRLSKKDLEEINHTLYPEGTTILPKVGAALLTNKRRMLTEPSSFDNNVMGWIPDEINPEFLYYVSCMIDMKAVAQKGAVPSISMAIAKSLKLPSPPLPEQRKIATVLYTVDQAIEKAEEIDTQLHRVKKGAKQRLFTFGINKEETQSHHIGDFPESWKFDKISNLAEIERGNTPRTSHDEYYGGDITWVTPDDLSDLNEDGNGKYISDSGRKLTPDGLESSSLTVVEPDSVMFTSRSYGIGRTAICTVPAATNQGITAFDCGETLDTEFFYYYLNYIMDYVVSISGGSTFPEISKSATGNIDVPVPGMDEQKEIASILSQFDEQILHNREVMSQLKQLKSGLSQDLFAGTVRTTDTNIEVPEEIAKYG
ncbi:restriction endonuclease subunit S [Halorubrum sp. SD690R]|uniref:restriction endonuclease subunit S n=1 Tax=Halorubrum sp. SD690R TaxID=2518117 RepID=UPI0010F8BB9D|nr:restriction endonuclease subunit S [Halorubrum sp. SD690R]TKX46349.1 restriction endonuclease subunit S [Halorubrum sp. SD690R]